MLDILFYFYSLLLVISAFMVILLKNPVHSVLFLIFAFFNAAALFIMLGAEFIAMMLIIVYVGAVAVLFLFIVMMMNINLAEIRQGFVKNALLAIALSSIIFFEMYIAIQNSAKFLPKPPVESMQNLSNTMQIANVLYTEYFAIFQLSGLILLVAMVGAIVLTLTHSNNVKRQSILKQVMRNKKNSLELVDVESGTGIQL